MSKIERREGNVIYANFHRKKQKTYKSKPTGVFIKPSGADTTMYSLRGNIAGFIASYIAFHPDFSPSLFGNQVREELGINASNDDPEPPSAA